MDKVRLLQDSFNMTSLALYASLGFDTKTSVALMQPAPNDGPDDTIRPVTEDDLDAVEELSTPHLPHQPPQRGRGQHARPLPPLPPRALRPRHRLLHHRHRRARRRSRPRTTPSRSSATSPARCRPISTASSVPLTRGQPLPQAPRRRLP